MAPFALDRRVFQRLALAAITCIPLLSKTTSMAQQPTTGETLTVTGHVVDADSDTLLPCRLYLQNLDSLEWYFPASSDKAGSAIQYRKQIGNTRSLEMHTTLSAHPFSVTLPPGRYRLRVERGKEYRPTERQFDAATQTMPVEVKLHRFVDMPQRGWYSGDTHLHRVMDELPNLVQAEDLNVAFPMNYWVRDSTEIPSASGPPLEAKTIAVDPTHVIYPLNTEYEIFSVEKQRHTQGAVFVLNHKTPLHLPTPPTLSVAEEARRQGALLDLDKHSWAWSMMIVPIMNVDLFELSNNHNWRTQFAFPQWTIENAPEWPEIERNEAGFTELGWTEFAMQTYYALLNCGFRMRVTGGTGSGVHPVPAGHGRVYVHTGKEFSYDRWIANLNAGHSFVTTGPLMDLRFNDALPGTTWRLQHSQNSVLIKGEINGLNRLKSIEILRNGVIAKRLSVEPRQSSLGHWTYHIDSTIELSDSSWVAVRCFEDLPDSKVSFAHTNPVYVDVQNRPLIPRRRDAEFFVQRMDQELVRNQGILSEESLGEYRRAREIYQSILDRAKD